MTELSIIVLSFNTSQITVKCLESIVKHYSSELREGKFEVIVVDNRSSDDSVSRIETFIKKNKSLNFTLIKSKENLGFGGGNNKGVSLSRGKNVLFLNSDTLVKDRGLISMSEFLSKNQGVGIAGGKLYNEDGSSQASVGIFYTVWSLFLTLFGGERLGFLRKSPDSVKSVDWVSGAFMMVKKEAFEKIGGFDKNIFMYVEDMELCYSMRKNGFDVMFFPNASVLHEKIGSSSRAFAIASIYKGIIYFFKKHRSSFEFKIALFFLLTKAHLAIFVGTITGNAQLTQTYKSALSF